MIREAKTKGNGRSRRKLSVLPKRNENSEERRRVLHEWGTVRFQKSFDELINDAAL